MKKNKGENKIYSSKKDLGIQKVQEKTGGKMLSKGGRGGEMGD